MTGLDCKELRDDGVSFEEGTSLRHIEWTNDGQVLTVGTREGDIYTYLASLPSIYDCFESRVVRLSSLLELSVEDHFSERTTVKVPIETEPAYAGLGPLHVAVGMNNQAWFYQYAMTDEPGKLVNQKEYLGTVDTIKLNERFAAVLSGGRIQIHPIVEEDDETEDRAITLPSNGAHPEATCMCLCGDFLIYGTARGNIHYFNVFEGQSVNEFKQDGGAIRKIYANEIGTRLIFEDDRHVVQMYNPVNDQVLPVPEFFGTLEAALWDSCDRHVFVLVDEKNYNVYVYADTSIVGTTINFLSTTPKTPSSRQGSH